MAALGSASLTPLLAVQAASGYTPLATGVPLGTATVVDLSGGGEEFTPVRFINVGGVAVPIDATSVKVFFVPTGSWPPAADSNPLHIYARTP